MSDFETAFRKTMTIEGGYVNDPLDRGGETYAGITRRSHPDWAGWPVIEKHLRYGGRPSELDRMPEVQEAVRGFYRRHYWDAIRLGEIERQEIAGELFDTAVNMGARVAVRFLQRAVNLVGRNNAALAEDALIGPKTLTRVNGFEFPRGLLLALNGLQFERYHQIVMNDATQHRFFRGWLRRVDFGS